MSDETEFSAASRLREARVGAGFNTAAEAARRFDWAKGTYRHHENGTRTFSPALAAEYAKAYGVTVGWLLGDNPARSYAEEVQAQIYPEQAIIAFDTVNKASLEEAKAVLMPIVNLSTWFDEKPEQAYLAFNRFLLDRVQKNRGSTSFTFLAINVDNSSTSPKLKLGDIVVVDRIMKAQTKQASLFAYTYSGMNSIHALFFHSDDTIEILDVDGAGHSIRVPRGDVGMQGEVAWIISQP